MWSVSTDNPHEMCATVAIRSICMAYL